MARERARWKFAVVAVLGAWVLRLMRLTWRIREEPRRFAFAAKKSRAGGPGNIYIHWHSRIVMAAATQAGCGVHVLVSEHADGEYIARTVGRLGFELVRGSTTHGGARSLIEIVRLLRAGEDVAITPDGPRGPRMRVQAGCVAAASRSGAKIVPIGFECSRAKRLRSWDRFMVPKSFVRVVALFGEPISVPPDLDEAGIEDWRRRVEAALCEMTRRAAEAVGVPVETADADPTATPAAPAG